MGDGSGDIIIKGGSVELEFDDTLYPKRQNDPGKHENAIRKITRIKITEKKNGQETVIFDSGDSPGGLKLETRFTTK